jgi:hypothetical protein
MMNLSQIATRHLVSMALVTLWLLVGCRTDSVTQQNNENERAKSDSASSEEVVLDEVKQKYIWDTEHVTFEIETYVGKKLKQAIRDRDPTAIVALCRDGFEADCVNVSLPEQLEQSGISKTVWKKAGETTLAGTAFADYLLERVAPFQSIDGVGMRVLKIDAENKDVSLGRWQIQMLITVKGRSAAGQTLFFKQESQAKLEFKSDEEVRTDSVFTKIDIHFEKLIESPELMVEATADYGLDRLKVHDNWTADTSTQYTHFMACADFDRDGATDLIISTLAGQVMLLKSESGRLVDVTEAYNLPNRIDAEQMHSTVSWIDFDNDDFPDLLLGENLFHNEQGKSFRWQPGTGIRLKYNPLGIAVADYDCDGLLDFYVCYQRGNQLIDPSAVSWMDDDKTGSENQLWRNLGNGKFENVTQRAGVGGGLRRSFAAVWFHANDDRFPDLYVANDFSKNSLFVNAGDGTFVDKSAESGTADFATSMGVAAGDVDGDGHTDIYVANMFSKMGRRIIDHVETTDYPAGIFEQLQGSCAGNRLYTRKGSDIQFSEISQQLDINGVGWAYSPALADFDRDGFLDIYATAGFMSFDRHKPDG